MGNVIDLRELRRQAEKKRIEAHYLKTGEVLDKAPYVAHYPESVPWSWPDRSGWTGQIVTGVSTDGTEEHTLFVFDDDPTNPVILEEREVGDDGDG